jgi:adenylate cyclase
LPREQRRLAAIVSSDLVGYSRLMGEDESGTLAALKAARREIVDPRLTAHGGRIVKSTGDGLLVEFASAVDAVRSVIEVQMAMTAFNAERPAERRIDFRVGVNVGDIIIDEGDIFGDGVNVAARLQEIAPPGGICVSDFVQQQVRGRIDSEFRDMGEQRVKNIAQPVRAWSVRFAGTAAPAPGPAIGERASRPSLAVLPFDNMGRDPETEAFCDGLSEDLITALSRFRWVSVASRTSSFAYKGKSTDVRVAARELGVRYVLEGSVRRVGKRVRINAQLIEASSGSHIWARRYDREMDDPFDLQDEIIRDVAGALDYALWHALVRGEGVSPNATTSPLRAAGWHITQVTAADSRDAIACCRRALAINPRSVAAYQYLVLASVNNLRLGWSADVMGEGTSMLEAGRQAVALNSGDSLSQAVLAVALMQAGDRASALAAARQALTLDGNSVNTLGTAAAALLQLGERDGMEMTDRVLDLVPAHYFRAGFLGMRALVCLKLGELDRGLKMAEEAVRLKPEALLGHIAESALLVVAGRQDDATAALARARSFRPVIDPLTVRGMLSFSARSESEQVLDALGQVGLDKD